ncbi:MAG TPA: type IV secretion system DNA-binding domain-containing protein [Candidatus Pacearchaeota archaeon]|nr:type IV secretion system DNA-binding domain-containing protein [Candidatus Pacearchaeota archaeon]
MEIFYPSNPIFYITLGLIVGLFFLLLFSFFSSRKKNFIKTSLNMVLFLIKLPKTEKVGNEKLDPKIMVGKMEQIFSNFLYLKGGGFWDSFFGDKPKAALEIASEFGGTDISFYIAVPKKIASALPKYVEGAYPDAIVQRMPEDYTIFEPNAFAGASFLRLKKTFFLPLNTYRNLDADPLEAIVNSLTNIRAEEGAAIQILIRPTNSDYAQQGEKILEKIKEGKTLAEAIASVNDSSLIKLFKAESSTQDNSKNSEQKIKVDEATLEALRSKIKKPFFEANIRLITSGKTVERANELLQNLESSFSQFHSSYNNFYAVRTKGRRAKKLIYNYIFRNFDVNEKVILSTEELASLYHFPLAHIESPGIKWAPTKEVEPPSILPSYGPVLLGQAVFRGQIKDIYIASAEDRRRHFYIVGQTGVGKSAFLREMIRQDIFNGEGVGVIDPHGELVEDVLRIIPENRANDVVLFEPFETNRPCGLNMLEWETPEEKDMAVSEMISIFYKLFPPETIGPMFEHYMRNAMLAIMADPSNPGTLIEIPRIFTDDNFMENKLQKVSDPLVRNFWLKEWKQTTGATRSDMLGYVISKIGRFVENEMLRNIVGQPYSGFNLADIMNQKKIFLANLSKGRTGELNSSLLGLILVSKMQMAAMKRAEIPQEERRDFYLYLDEFQNFTTESIATILSEARKYRLNLILAHQYIPQLTETIKNAVIGNVGSFAVFRVGADDAEFLENQFAPEFSKLDLLNLDNFELIIKMMVNNKLASPFKMKTLKPTVGNNALAQAIKKFAHEKYGQPKEIVEKEISRALSL